MSGRPTYLIPVTSWLLFCLPSTPTNRREWLKKIPSQVNPRTAYCEIIYVVSWGWATKTPDGFQITERGKKEQKRVQAILRQLGYEATP